VPPGSVVEMLDVVGDGGVSLFARGELLVVDVLGLQRGEEALGDGVVVAVARPALLVATCRASSVGADTPPWVGFPTEGQLPF
jgi:hypothetical protein